jgi:hypothetical protein
VQRRPPHVHEAPTKPPFSPCAFLWNPGRLTTRLAASGLRRVTIEQELVSSSSLSFYSLTVAHRSYVLGLNTSCRICSNEFSGSWSS